jgi:indolepyruvate decarboxylase
MALPNMRPIVLLGDGSFQMTGLELVSLVRFKVNPIVIVLNNRGYGTERPMLDGTFNDVQYIHHEKFPEILGSGKGFQVKTEEEFVDALKKSYENKNSLSIIDVTIARGDCSPALKRLTEALGKRVNNKK